MMKVYSVATTTWKSPKRNHWWFSVGHQDHQALVCTKKLIDAVQRHLLPETNTITKKDTPVDELLPLASTFRRNAGITVETHEYIKVKTNVRTTTWRMCRVRLGRARQRCVIMCHDEDAILYTDTPDLREGGMQPDELITLLVGFAAASSLFAKQPRHLTIVFMKDTCQPNQPEHNPSSLHKLEEVFCQALLRCNFILTTPQNNRRICRLCMFHSTLKCACKNARYCSPDCQEVDWKTHKHTCGRSEESQID